MIDVSATLAAWMVRWRWPLLALGIVLAALAWYPAQNLTFDRSVANMFAADDPLLPPFLRLQRTFGASELVMAVYTDEGVLNPDLSGLKRLETISAAMQKVPGVRDVLSLERPIGEEIVNPESEIAARVRGLFEGYTHSKDGKTVGIVCLLETEKDALAKDREQTREKTIGALRATFQELLAKEKLGEGMLAGEPVMVNDGFSLVEEDGRRLGWATTVLLGLTILVCFRSLRWVIIPIAVVQTTILLTEATLSLCHVQLSMVSSMLVAIITVVGIATVVHVIILYRELRQEGKLPVAALIAAAAALVMPIFWAHCTDLAGFGSLTAARAGPVQSFGMMCALGSVMVAIPCVLLVPGLALAGDFDSDPQVAWGEGSLHFALDGVLDAVRSRPLLVGVVSITAALAASAGAIFLEVESDFTKNFRESSSIVAAYDFIETKLGGAGVWDVMIRAPKKLDVAYLERVARFEERLRKEVKTPAAGAAAPGRPGLTKVFSLADAVFEGAPVDPRQVPVTILTSPDLALQTQLAVMRGRMPVFFQTLHAADPESPEKYWLRIMLRSEERQSASQKKAIIETVARLAQEEFPEAEAEVTGFFVLLASLIDSIIRDNWTTFGLATSGIAAMLFIAFVSELRTNEWPAGTMPSWGQSLLWSLRLTLIGLVPNVMPVLVVTGLVGWLGLKINMGAAMIAAVSMGLTVDSSLHYLCGYLRLRAKGEGFHQALNDVHHSVGRAMVFSTLALVIGFLVLCISEFVPTIYFGGLTMLTMLGGMAGNLVVLPVLLQLVEGEKEMDVGKASEIRASGSQLESED